MGCVRWFTSDLHLGHTNIIGYTSRPYATTAGMDADLVKRWNAVVGADDEVWVLGDLALGRLDDSLRSVRALQGRIVLVPGNHDRVAAYHRRAAAETSRYRAAGVDAIVHGPAALELAGRTVLADHFPYAGDSHGEDRYAEYRPVDTGLWLLHGHVHTQWRQSGRMINVGIDAWGGAPVAEDDVAALVAAGPADLAPVGWS
jgi:calcineurin-like phosphoesterase family protein